ncbi:MAG: DUF5696 domain-containing protein [Oscillospiraceae bacterium]|nr:DUF5696 domain-containing protein [Oscillospiraceae bacterium]
MLINLKKPVTAIGVIILLAGVISGLRYINIMRGFPGLPSHVYDNLISNDTLTRINKAGIEIIAENDNFTLSLDFNSGNIEMLHKQAGYTWRSSPGDADMALEESGTLWLGNLQSPVMFAYADDMHSMLTRLGNVHNQSTEMQVFRLPDGGTRVFYFFHETGIEIGYDMHLTKYGLKIDVPANLVRDNGAGPLLTDFVIFPFLGATRSDTDDTGYLFLPDGPGALVHFHLHRDFNNSFVETVYGSDLAYVTDTGTTNIRRFFGSAVEFPVYGIHRNNNSMMVIIDGGEGLADIIGNPAYVQTGFNSAYARFSYRKSFSVITNAQTGEGYFRYSDETFNELRSLQFHFLTGEDAGWFAMAETYRDYLVEKKRLVRRPKENIPFTVFLTGGDMTQATLGSRFVPTTTFEQASEILQYFHDMGVEDMVTIYYGWQKRGNSVRSPDKYPAARQLGGDRGLRQMIVHANNLGYSVILSDNFSTITKTGRGIRLRRDTVYNAQGFSVFGGWHLSATATRKMFDRNWSRLEGYGADGILPQNTGRFLMTDFNTTAPMGRTMVMEAIQDISGHMQNTAGLLYHNRSRAFLIRPDAVFFNMPLEGTHLIMLDETVPFFPVALHGYVKYYGESYNDMSEPAEELLRALSWGALPNFDLMYAASEDLWVLENTYVYNSKFEARREEFLEVYNRFRNAYYLISDKVITSYSESGGIREVVFEDIIIYLNMNREEIVHNGVIIPGLDFIVREG